MAIAIDSRCWKASLARLAQKLKRRCLQRRWSNWSADLLFLEVNMAFLCIRKLIEMRKLTDRTRLLEVKCEIYKNRKAVNFLNAASVDRLYDFSTKRRSRLGLQECANQIIHSYVWSLLLQSDGSIRGILVCSDRGRQRGLYLIAISEIVRIIGKVAADEVKEMSMTRDLQLGDFRINYAR